MAMHAGALLPPAVSELAQLLGVYQVGGAGITVRQGWDADAEQGAEPRLHVCRFALLSTYPCVL